MNCNQFGTLSADVSRDDSLAAPYREQVLAHAEECPECAAQMAAQVSLTVGLKKLAASSDSTGAPPSVEAALIAAFRERADKSPQAQHGGTKSGWRRAAIFALAAAASLVLLVVAITRLIQGPDSAERSLQTKTGSQAVERKDPPEQAPKAPHQLSPQPELPGTSSSRESVRRDLNRNYRRASGAAGAPTVSAPAGEVATDFFPLTTDDLLPTEGGRVIRIKLPRSAMAPFGLPINMERPGDSINADVVVGNDGLARAIRFVR